MLGYIAKRIASILVTTLGVSAIVFLIMALSPGDPVEVMFGMRPGFEVTKETYLAIFHRLGLDRPLYVQYFDWLWKLLNGDFGYSYVRGIPVREYIVRRTMNTLPLTAVGLLLSIAIAIPTGIVAAVNLHKAKDMVATSFATLMWSLPWFWYELMLILLFSVYLGWFPTYGMAEPGSSLFEQARHMFLPAFAYGTLGAGFLARITRSSMLEVLGQDYIVTARSKGLKERIVIYKHALGNAMLPIVTVMGLYFGMLIGGAAITETVFAWPGMGSLIVQAANERDYPVVMGLTVLISVFVTTCVLLTDIIYALLDPRIRY